MNSLIETDSLGGTILPGHRNQKFLVRENPDGSILLQPAHILTEAQYAYDTDLDLSDLLARASASPTIRRNRQKRT